MSRMAVGALEPRFYAALIEGLGLADPPDRGDPGNWPKLLAQAAGLFTATFAERTRDQWTTIFEGSEACAEPVLSLRFSRTPGELSDPAPAPGEHTAEALAEWGPGRRGRPDRERRRPLSAAQAGVPREGAPQR